MKKTTFRSSIFLALVLIFLYLPVVTVVLFSFNASTARTPIEMTGFTLRWYGELFQDATGFGASLMVSLRVAVLSVLMASLIGTFGAIGMVSRAVKKSALMGAAETLVTLPILIPEIILGIALMLLFRLIGVPMGEVALVIAHTTFCIPYVYMNVKSRLAGMDPALGEAARDLGATPRRVLLDITLPLVRPAVLTGAFLSLAMSLDDFVISYFVSGTSTTLPIRIYSSVKSGVSPQVNALCTLMMLTVFVLVGVGQFMLPAKRRKGKKRYEPRSQGDPSNKKGRK